MFGSGPAMAQSFGMGNAVHGPQDQVIVGEKVVGKDPDANVRLEIWCRVESMGSGVLTIDAATVVAAFPTPRTPAGTI
jgi:hypothetical protein